MDEIVSPPETYIPKMDHTTKKYEDHDIGFDFSNGIRCPCYLGSHTFQKRQAFKAHQKCARHKRWLQHLNDNAMNYYQQALANEDIIKNQQKILTKLENDIKAKDLRIHSLEGAIADISIKKEYTNTVTNLLEFD
jgi:hypothetical protein